MRRVSGTPRVYGPDAGTGTQAKSLNGNDGRPRRARAALPGTTRDLSDDGRPTYKADGKAFVFHRTQRADAVDPETGERLDDVLVFYVPDLDVKELMLADERGITFTTPHWNGYRAVLLRIPDLGRIDRDELEDMVVEAWLTRAPKRVAKAWISEHGADD